MQCPVCHVDLQMAERQGIEVDYCPKCRGVWLDRGELDKIIERSATELGRAAAPVAPPAAPPIQGYPNERDYRDENRYRDDDDYYKQHPHHKRRKREGFLGELFDFD